MVTGIDMYIQSINRIYFKKIRNLSFFVGASVVLRLRNIFFLNLIQLLLSHKKIKKQTFSIRKIQAFGPASNV